MKEGAFLPGCFSPGFHLYSQASSSSFLSGDLPTLEELYSTKLTHIDQINTARQVIMQLIFYFKQEAGSSDDQNQVAYVDYLKVKQKLFMQYHGLEELENQICSLNVWIFDSLNLLELFGQLQEVLKQLTSLVKKKFGQKNSQLKIEGFFLLQQLSQFLAELKDAAFAYKLYKENQYLFYRFDQLAQFSNWLQIDKQRESKFKINQQPFIVHSIVELGYQIEAKSVYLKKQEDKKTKDQNWKKVLQQINEASLLSQKKATQFYFQTLHHYDQTFFKPISLKLQKLKQFCQNIPINKLRLEALEQLRSQQIIKNISFSKFYRSHKKIIKTIRAIILKKSDKMEEIQQFLLIFIGVIEKWLKLNRSNPDKLLLENYVAVWKIVYQTDKPKVIANQESIYEIVKIYTETLLKNLLDYRLDLIEKIIAYDQEITYEILTSQTIMGTLFAQQNKIKDLLEEFAPLLQLGKQLYKIVKNASQAQLVTQIFGMVDDLGKQDFKQHLMAASKLKIKRVQSNIDVILNIEYEDQSFNFLKSYLKQFKHILMLLQVLKDPVYYNNIGKSTQDQYNKLRLVANYFSRQRPDCVFYELKSQILLFISLFKLGYHDPTCKREGKIINTRSNILKLYTKLYNQNRTSNIFMSKISFDLLQRKSSSEQYYVFDPKTFKGQEKVTEDLTCMMEINEEQGEESSWIELGASQALAERIRHFIKNINRTTGKQSSGKTYLLNLMNILENELFLQERQHYKNCSQIITSHYIQHVKNNIDLPEGPSQSFKKLLKMEGLFFNEQYQQAWKMLTTQLRNNQYFVQVLEEISRSSSNKNHLLKLVRVYQVFTRMYHLLYAKDHKESDLQALMEAINSNTSFPVERKAIKALYDISVQQKRKQQLQEFFARFKEGSHKSSNQFKAFDSELKTFGIQTLINDNKSKEIILVKIPEKHSQLFSKLKSSVQKYYLLNIPGLSRITEMKEVSGQLWMYIEGNPFYVSKIELNKSILKSTKQDYIQSSQQKFMRNLALIFLQAYHLFSVNQDIVQKISLDCVKIEYKQYFFNINPYFMLIYSIFITSSSKEQKLVKKSNNKNYSLILSRLWLADILQQLFNPFRSQCCLHFISNYDYLLQSLRSSFHSPKKYNSLLEMPLFMTLRQKEIFIVYFDNKMSQMSDQYFNNERKLKKEKKYSQLYQLRVKQMKDDTFKNNRYNFCLGGILECRMIDENVCKNSIFEKLNWQSGHKNLKISYQLPRNEDNSIKEYVYSLNFFTKCLRGAIAHKMDHSYDIILSFNHEYPQLIDFLYAHKHLLTMNYEQMIARKNQWLNSYFLPDGDKTAKQLKKLISSYDRKQQNSGNINSVFKKLQDYCYQYEHSTLRALQSMKVKCHHCKNFVQEALRSNNLIDLLLNLSKVQSKKRLLTVEHYFHNCFLDANFKDHRQIKVFGEKVREGQVKNYFTLTWWFFLQTTFPSLIEMMNRVRHQLFLEEVKERDCSK